MAKIDLKKELKYLYNPPAQEVTLVDVPRMNFITVDGGGAPESKTFQQSIEALYTIAYTIKFDKKKSGGTDFGVMALEGLWYAENLAVFQLGTGDRDQWRWTLMIMQPDFITSLDFVAAQTAAKKKKDNPVIDMVRFDGFTEGKAVQIMHIGPFLEEGLNIQRLHDKIALIGGILSGKHHEIYLSDFRKVDPAKMKTVLRQPYKI